MERAVGFLVVLLAWLWKIWYQAYRLYAYQRPQIVGWSHSKILVGVVGLNIVLSVLAVFACWFPKYILISLFMALAVSFIAYICVEKIQPMYDERK
jgi:hypothetical protein